MSNAVKFSDYGSNIKVKYWMTIEIGAYLHHVSVKDYGVGINKEDQRKLFEPFFQSSKKENKDRNPNGHGIGLSICKKIAASMDGDIQVKSIPGEKTIFTFTFREKLAKLD
jgi:signal transduction histidine kinase